MSTSSAKELAQNGYIATLRRARKAHKCSSCGFPVEPGQEYCEVIRAGGGLGWLKRPDRTHTRCIPTYLEVKRC